MTLVKKILATLTIMILMAAIVTCTAAQTNENNEALTNNNENNPRAQEIVCRTAYRTSVTRSIEVEDSILLPDADTQESHTYTDLTFNVQYWSGEFDGERGLQVSVTEVGQTDFLASQLYQFSQDSGPQNQFAGGHGFTGLHYTYHPTSGAELQYWCAVP